MLSDNPFPAEKEIKPLLGTARLTANDLRNYLLLTFASLKLAGQAAGYSDDVRVVQILTGYKLPKNPLIIRRIALAWNIDTIVLTQLFDRLGGDSNGN